MLSVVHDTAEQPEAPAVDGPEVGPGPDLDELCRLAARQMVAVALEAERRAYLDAHAGMVDAAGGWWSATDSRSAGSLLPPGRSRRLLRGWMIVARVSGSARRCCRRNLRKSPKVTEVLPILYLRGLSTGDFAPALAGFVWADGVHVNVALHRRRAAGRHHRRHEHRRERRLDISDEPVHNSSQ
jgi:putative transposase